MNRLQYFPWFLTACPPCGGHRPGATGAALPIRQAAPLAAGRLQILDPEHVAFDLKSVCSDGTYQILLSRMLSAGWKSSVKRRDFTQLLSDAAKA